MMRCRKMAFFPYALLVALAIGLVAAAPAGATYALRRSAPAGMAPALMCNGDWQIAASPNIAGTSNMLYAVAALTTSDAWAVGHSGTHQTKQALIERWDGTAWTIVPSPQAGVSNALHGVAAITSNNVWAVGHYFTGAPLTRKTLIERWDGTAWTIVPSPNYPQQDGGDLDAVAAVSASDIWAVGHHYNSATDASQTLIEHWDGTRWQLVSSPNAGSSDNFLFAVAAIAPDDVWAVGWYVAGTPKTEQTLIERWDGTGWRIVPSPNPGSNSELAGVVAVSASAVWAVGASASGTLVERWDGTSWSVVASPGAGTLNAVTAVSASAVWAVGGYRTAGGPYQTLITYWDGTSWSVVASPSPGSAYNSLYGVASLPAGQLVAVGLTQEVGAPSQTLAEYEC